MKNADKFKAVFGLCAAKLWVMPEGEFSKWLNSESTETEQRWIPCSERLPEIKEYHVSDVCIVYCENGAYGFAELEENIFGQVGWNCERDDEYHEPLGNVLAWMPLPKPYKEKMNEKR